MKKFSRIFAMALIAISMFSCNVIDITKKRYSNGYYVSLSNAQKVEAQNNIVKESKGEQVSEVKKEKCIEKPVMEIATINIAQEEIVPDINVSAKAKTSHKKKDKFLAQNKPIFAIKSSKFALNSVQVQEQKLINKTAQKNKGASDADLVLLVILAILLPPLAVFLKRGLDSMFWISLILTLLFWFPGVIFALLVVLDAI